MIQSQFKICLISFFFIMLFSSNVSAENKNFRELINQKRELLFKLRITQLRLIQTDKELESKHERILRTTKKLSDLLEHHSEIQNFRKKSKRKKETLFQLQKRLLSDDEKLSELNQKLLRKHKEFNELIENKTEIIQLRKKIIVINKLIEKY